MDESAPLDQPGRVVGTAENQHGLALFLDRLEGVGPEEVFLGVGCAESRSPQRMLLSKQDLTGSGNINWSKMVLKCENSERCSFDFIVVIGESSMNTTRLARNFRLALLCGAIAFVGPCVQARANDARSLVLPKSSETIPGKRIGWNFDNVSELLTNANADGKPIVAVMIAKRCGWCRIFLTHVLRCDGLNAFAGQAHFVILYAPEVRPDSKEESPESRDSKQFMNLLKVEGYPTTAIVNVKNKTFSPVGKVAGASSEAGIIGLLTAAGLKAGESVHQTGRSAAFGLPNPAACGTIVPTDALAASSPGDVQRGISP